MTKKGGYYVKVSVSVKAPSAHLRNTKGLTMNEQEFQELLTKLDSYIDEYGDELIEVIKLRQFHAWLDEQLEEVNGNTR